MYLTEWMSQTDEAFARSGRMYACLVNVMLYAFCFTLLLCWVEFWFWCLVVNRMSPRSLLTIIFLCTWCFHCQCQCLSVSCFIFILYRHLTLWQTVFRWNTVFALLFRHSSFQLITNSHHSSFFILGPRTTSTWENERHWLNDARHGQYLRHAMVWRQKYVFKPLPPPSQGQYSCYC